MKLFIQIPCFNEEQYIEQTIKDLPTKIPDVSSIDVVIIDDGSKDRTIDKVKELGIKHVIKLKRNTGLANAFQEGIDYCLKKGADIIVNTDADNQYKGSDISKLIKPILNEEADMVIGSRPIENNPDFSFLKKKLQTLGTYLVRILSNSDVKDAASGFRAFNRKTAAKISILNNFSYTLESIFQLSFYNLKITSVQIGINKKVRESRLFKNIFSYLFKNFIIILRVFLIYKPLKLFLTTGVLLIIFSIFIGYYWLLLFLEDQLIRLPTLTIFILFFISGLIISLLGVITDIQAKQRILLEKLYFYEKFKK